MDLKFLIIPRSPFDVVVKSIISSVICLLLVGVLNRPPDNEIHAFCVGVNSADVSDETLECPFNRDAIVIHDMLQENNIKSELLYGPQATKQNVIDGLEEMAKNSKSNDVNLLLFSTHGGVSKGEYNISLKDGRLSGSELITIVKKMKGIVIIVIDACQSGAILNYQTPDNVIIFASCKTKQYARWTPLSELEDDQPCGYLTRPVCRALAGYSDLNNNKKLEVFEILVEIILTEIPQPQPYCSNGRRVVPEKQEPVFRIPNKLVCESIK